MANENNEILLKKFIKNSESECLIINGDFGIGKTFFITDRLEKNEFIKENKILYSINNNIKDFEINNLKKNIILNSNIKESKNKVAEYGLQESVIKEIIKNNSFLKKWGVSSLSKILENKYLNNVKFNNQIVVLDELERILTTKEKINELFYSLINLKENNKNIKIILIINERALEQEVEESLNNWKEKITDYTINIEKEDITPEVNAYSPKTSNLRILKKMDNILKKIEIIKKEKQEKIDNSIFEEYKKEIITKIEIYYSPNKKNKDPIEKKDRDLIDKETVPLFLLDDKKLKEHILEVCKFKQNESSLNERIKNFYNSINEFFVNYTDKNPEKIFDEIFDELNKKTNIISAEPAKNKFLLLNFACEGYEVFYNIEKIRQKIESKLVERIKQNVTKEELIKIQNWVNEEKFNPEMNILEKNKIKELKKYLNNKIDLETLIQNKKNDAFEKIVFLEDIETEDELILLLNNTNKLKEILDKENLNNIVNIFTTKHKLIYNYSEALTLFEKKITNGGKYNFYSIFLKYEPPEKK